MRNFQGNLSVSACRQKQTDVLCKTFRVTRRKCAVVSRDMARAPSMLAGPCGLAVPQALRGYCGRRRQSERRFPPWWHRWKHAPAYAWNLLGIVLAHAYAPKSYRPVDPMAPLLRDNLRSPVRPSASPDPIAAWHESKGESVPGTHVQRGRQIRGELCRHEARLNHSSRPYSA